MLTPPEITAASSGLANIYGILEALPANDRLTQQLDILNNYHHSNFKSLIHKINVFYYNTCGSQAFKSMENRIKAKLKNSPHEEVHNNCLLSLKQSNSVLKVNDPITWSNQSAKLRDATRPDAAFHNRQLIKWSPTHNSKIC